MSAATVRGVTLEYEIRGDGEPMLLVMGLNGQLIHWPDGFVDLLVARGLRVIRFDNRDVGLSTKTDAPPPGTGRAVAGLISRRWARSAYRMADLAEDACGLLDHLGIERAHVVGASMGGMIAQSLAIAHPDRVATLTSIMSNTGDKRFGQPALSLIRRLPQFLDDDPTRAVDNAVEVNRLISGPHFDPAESRAVAERAIARSHHPAGPAHQVVAISASPDRTTDLTKLTMPTLVIHGLLDRLVAPSGGLATARAITHSRLLMFPDMGHDLPRPRWQEMIDAIVTNTRRAPVADPAHAPGRPH